jgi:hypothetical protein
MKQIFRADSRHPHWADRRPFGTIDIGADDMVDAR